MTDPHDTPRLDAEQRDEQVAQLFCVIFDPGDLVEYRPLHSERNRDSKRQQWHLWTGDAGDLRGILDDIEPLIPQGYNMFFGANPRKTRGGGGEDVALARCLFCEFDKPLHGADDPDAICSRQEALQRIEDAGLPFPSAVMESGRGVHCYWRLTEPMTDLAAWSAIQKAVIRRLQSDPIIHDRPRLMRLPGMFNAKRGRIATLVHADPQRVYDLAEFDAVVEEARRAEEARQERVAAVEVKPGGMSEMTRGLVEHGTLLNGGGRRQSLFTAACDLKAHGWSKQDAVKLLLPVGKRLGLSVDEVDDLRRQVHNAFSRPREPYAYDPMEREVEVVRAGEKSNAETRVSPRLPTLIEQLQAFKQYRAGNAGRTLVGLETGFSRLDEKLSGMSGLSIIAAAPGAGKTSLTLQLGLQTLYRNPSCCFLFFSCEMQAREIAGRLLTMRTSMDYRRLSLPGLSRGGIDPLLAKADDEVIEQAIDDLQAVASRMRMIPPEMIIEASSGDLASWMQRRSMEVMEETGSTEVVCILDNLQQAPFQSTRNSGEWLTDLERDRYAIESMMRLQHGLAGQADRAATILVSEVSKAAMKEGAVDMTAIIGSIRSVYKADCVMVMSQAERRGVKRGNSWTTVDLFAPRSSDPTAADFGRRCVDLVITKARAPGDKGRLLFGFDHRLHRMDEIDEATAVRVDRDNESAEELPC
jgi:hypothetical protein